MAVTITVAVLCSLSRTRCPTCTPRMLAVVSVSHNPSPPVACRMRTWLIAPVRSYRTSGLEADPSESEAVTGTARVVTAGPRTWPGTPAEDSALAVWPANDADSLAASEKGSAPAAHTPITPGQRCSSWAAVAALAEDPT